MASANDFRWWARYVLVPLIVGSSGLIALIIHFTSNSGEWLPVDGYKVRANMPAKGENFMVRAKVEVGANSDNVQRPGKVFPEVEDSKTGEFLQKPGKFITPPEPGQSSLQFFLDDFEVPPGSRWRIVSSEQIQNMMGIGATWKPISVR